MASSPRRSIPGRIQCVAHLWVVDFTDETGQAARLPVPDEDAWNFDIEHNLPVTFRLHEGRVRLISRKGNKKYVTIATAA